jgi:UPF0271 protein
VAARGRIDLNADVGEGLDTDAALIPLVTSANIACGAHAGDEATMRRTVALALRHGVAVGAHPGYPDREGFGRRDLDLPDPELRASLASQLEALIGVAAAEGAVVRHVKVHGALYHRGATDARVARAIADVALATCGAVTLVGPAGSRLLEKGRAVGLPVAAEAFADRAYEPDGSLRSRSRPGAVHADPERVARQALAIARDGRVLLEDGAEIAVEADTICLHGDTPGAVVNAAAVREALARAGIAVAPI